MKTKIILLVLMVFSSLLFFTACNEHDGLAEPDFATDVVAKATSEGFKMASEAHMINAVQRMLNKPLSGVADAQKIKVATAGIAKQGRYYYLYADAVKEGKRLSVAIELVPKKQGARWEMASLFSAKESVGDAEVIYMLGESHTCAGNPCSSCSFTRDSEDKVTGCNCGNQYGGKCNHTVIIEEPAEG